MSKQKFKVGDRVRIVRSCVSLGQLGDIGEIVTIDSIDSRLPYLVKIECTGYRPQVWCYEVEHIREKHPVIVITSDGKTTTAVLRKGKKVIKTAAATCSDKDTFSFDEGARIAFERLQGRDPFPKEQKREYYNGKVVCVKSPFQWWTVGKVYVVRDGRITADDGDVFPRKYQTPYKDADDIRHAGCDLHTGDGRHNRLNEFIPLVED